MRQLVYTSLLLLITVRFTYGARKICSTIKKSQNIMTMIVDINDFIDHIHCVNFIYPLEIRRKRPAKSK